ncbi:MAG: glutathione S-transferase family protein [Alphaproteobacteria bacterium]|nr:glutathione S-transferase family protein [Alphaproteobacteria bacterium]MBL6939002.1 glutathione S-transferase family protein [Alphaproteobacteria bacterium]MBL7099594.1 glutathione S-transferase family protein [Alphaproteobacteria bacterium]
MTIQLSAFKSIPDFARGQVRDLRVRWALEEAGIPYTTKLLGQGEQKSEPYVTDWQPFGQVPAIHEDGLHMFESGAIVLHIGETSDVLLPKDPAGRARATQWLLCALNTMEVVIQQYASINIFFANEEWAKLRKPSLEEQMKGRLHALSKALGSKDWLDARFTAGDLLMITVLRILNGTNFLDATPNLVAYKKRGEARSAFQRALNAQIADIEGTRSAA